MIAVDTNLFVYAHRAETAEHARARRALSAAADDPRGWGVALPCLAELWSVATHPLAPGRPSAGSEVAAFVESLVVDGGLEIWAPRADLWQRLARTAARLEARGRAIFDLQVALIALESGASEIWTRNRSFPRLPGLSVRDPIS